jgi:large conductance mechanosensitive channel
MGIISEFKEFALKGNAVDLAIGVIIGGAFGKIVSSVVADIILPPIGLLTGGVNFSDLKLVLKQATIGPNGQPIPAVTLNYGVFLQTCVDFLIVAVVVFLLVKAMNALKKPQPTPEASGPSEEVNLLTEIRDLLKAK